MLIGEIKLGKIDAKNEVLRDEDRTIFENSFMIPNGFKIDLFEKKEKFIIYGTKGSGKTALLRYLQIQEQKREITHTSFYSEMKCRISQSTEIPTPIQLLSPQ